MEASYDRQSYKDTVMAVDDVLKADGLGIKAPQSAKDYYMERRIAILEAQAEISFKAGQQESDKRWREILRDTVFLAKATGRREVVEWIDGHSWIPENNIHAISIWGKEWQAKLESWPIRA